ncbi:MAG: FdtA/QdtA family cupin domain-containing protein [Gammaproteobacteria bacterium]|nr:FdtA/QdtA family cupin domain-containing protein [Gammaproteobacteria bacterium]
MLPSLDSVKIIKLPYIVEENGDLVIMEAADLPFDIARVFVVRAETDAVRGCHAHKMCSQFLTCPQGQVEVLCDDAENTAQFSLDAPNLGLYIPAGIWASQKYEEPNSVLTVLCDLPFDESDYIRFYGDYLAYRREQSV